MLNRTLRTMSATLNRLDLGTRLFAQAATTNMGPKSLRIRHAHPQAVVEIARAGISPGVEYPPFGGEFLPESPGSSFALRPWCDPSRTPRPVAEAPASDRRRVVVQDDQPRRSGVPARARGAIAALAGGMAEG